ncbi:MAG: enoyl-CoA hydratase/isomerase family protein, partial [Candidatus Dormibacteraeota bacterium]|nr:enoyl-CoA hydratase/isomerase family protein [Candidatus Dormibacteraeota bacterium]
MAEVLLERVGSVAVLTLAAPARRNAFVASMVTELVEACEKIDADLDVGAVVLQAQGPSFCAGAHRELLAAATKDPAAPEAYRGLNHVYRGFTRVAELLPPVVAAVRGDAVGAGVNLMLAADLRVVAESARIQAGFLRLGLHPGGGHFTLVGRVAGREAAAALGLFGRTVDGRRAVALGLAWEALPEAEVEPRALEIAAGIAGDPELARAAARTFRLELGPPAATWPAA